MRRSRAMVFAAALVACHDTDAIELPEIGADIKTLAVIVLGPEGPTVFVIDPADRQTTVTFPSAPNTELYLLQYQRTLAALDLAPGVQELDLTDQGPPMPIADVVLEADIQGTNDATWNMVPALPDSVPQIRLLRPIPCVEFATEAVEIPGAVGNGRVLEVLDEDSALLGTDHGEYYLIEGGRAIRQTQIPDTTPGHSSVRAADGDIWVVSDRGRVARGDHLRGFRPAPSLNVRGDGHAIIRGAPPGSPFELYATTNEGNFERFENGAWTKLEHAKEEYDYNWRGGLAWIRPGKVIVIGPRYPMMLRYDNGEVVPENPFDPDTPSEVELIPSMGLVAGSEDGSLVRYDEAARTWQSIEASTLGIRVIAPLDRGLLFGGTVGALAQYQPDLGSCESVSYAPWHIVRLVPFGTGFILLSESEHEMPIEHVYILRRID